MAAMMVIWSLLVFGALLCLAGAAVVGVRSRPPRARSLAGRPCATYLLPSRGPRPAYIGKSFMPRARIGCHRREADWWPLVDEAAPPVVEWHPSEAAALAHERHLIRTLAPLGNERHNRGRGIEVL